MPKKARMESWKKKRRQEYMEMKEYRYYIFCEGQQTEPRDGMFIVQTSCRPTYRGGASDG